MKLKEPKSKFENVMLIDDSELDNFINEKTIESHHFAKKIYVHTSAKSALEFLSNLMTMGDKYTAVCPQVIFIDINMPMMDGFQFLEHYKKNAAAFFSNTQLVILTSSVHDEDRQRAAAISSGITFLKKPLTKAMLENISK